ncbi:MAG: radical SAM superfamily protein [Methanobrevibacter sp. CfCl-M3]
MMKMRNIVTKYSFDLKDVKTILNNKSGVRSFFLGDYTLNPYMGCSFDCSYCYVNGSKYVNQTSSLTVKSNACEILRTKLKNKAKNGERAVMILGSATECYMPIEKELGLTRDILKIINRFRFAVHIITKSDLILRDIDILKKIQKSAILPQDIVVKYKGNENELYKLKAILTFSFSTTDDKIAKIFEYNTPRPSKRLKTIKRLKKEGFLTGVSLMPTLPFISDTEEGLNKIFSDFKKYDVDYIIHGSLTLFGDSSNHSKARYLGLLKEYCPEIYEKTAKMFQKKDNLSKIYQKELNERVFRIAKNFNIKVSII